jgi:hypothetical protein
MRTIYVDVDGTLLSNELDTLFAIYGVEWYEQQRIDNLPKRYWLLIALFMLRLIGFRLVLWTNRGHMNAPATKRNLGVWWWMFSDHQFHEGYKVKPSSGWTIDDQAQHATVRVRPYIA